MGIEFINVHYIALHLTDDPGPVPVVVDIRFEMHLGDGPSGMMYRYASPYVQPGLEAWRYAKVHSQDDRWASLMQDCWGAGFTGLAPDWQRALYRYMKYQPIPVVMF